MPPRRVPRGTQRENPRAVIILPTSTPMHRTDLILPFLRSRPLRLVILAFQAIWLNAIVPGHTRGGVQVAGSECQACGIAPAPLAARPCCHPDTKSSHDSPRAPIPGDPASHCAICYFAAMLSPAVAVDITHPPLVAVALVEALPALAAPRAQVFPTYLGRAPPAC